jgi:primosomal protein N' (replication factor Y)
MPTYLEIAVNVPQVSGTFHYHLPPELDGRVWGGHLVEIPFGKQRVQGVVIQAVGRPEVAETKPVLRLLDAQPVLTPAQLALAQALAESTLAPLAAFVDLMLPPGLGQQADSLYTPTPGASRPLRKLSPTQKRLMDLLSQRGPLRGRQIDALLRHINWRPAARALAGMGLLVSQSVLPPPSAQPKMARTVQLACPPAVAESRMAGLGRDGSQALARRQAMLRSLLREPGPVSVSWVYAESGGNLADLRALAELGLVSLGESEVWRDPLAQLDVPVSAAPALTRDQAVVWAEVEKGLQAAAGGQPTIPFLLHGVTGSGKTEIYLRAVEYVLRQGRQALVLVPEIALTPQTVRRFMARFPGQVGLTHSQLSAGERYDTWRRARAGSLAVGVGPRSALFLPFPNVGLIVVDECHDDSYYQDDPPFYHARQAAVIYARLAGAVCLLGSATPDLVSAYLATKGERRYLRLPNRILAHRQAIEAQVKRLEASSEAGRLVSQYRPLEAQAETIDLPPVRVVDMRQELRQGNRSMFSRSLQAALGQVLERSQQAILFLNRRGTATYVFCRDCGLVLKCPRCDLPLAYHTRAASELLCHHCGYTRNMPPACPNCGSAHIRQYGAGTEQVEAQVLSLYPQARTLRWDYETTRQKGAHEVILSHFANHRADVLIGTQMLAKGLDLPLVTLVGVVLADVGLNLPDAYAPERTFQVLTQVAGRAGRSPLGGEVILQTFQPEHYVIQAAAEHNYRAFYLHELEYRRQLRYPPFTHLVRLEYRHSDPAQPEAAAQKLAARLRQWIKEEQRQATDLVGPVPCFYARLGGLYRWQIIVRGPDPVSLLRGRPLEGWRVEVNPPSLL